MRVACRRGADGEPRSPDDREVELREPVPQIPHRRRSPVGPPSKIAHPRLCPWRPSEAPRSPERT
eukprot:6155502-Pyramimonas_sp.AAC.1